MHAQTLACAFECGLSWILQVTKRYVPHKPLIHQTLVQGINRLFDEEFVLRDLNWSATPFNRAVACA